MEKRNSNFELMRITSMFLIVIWHILMHGNVITNCMNPTIKTIFEIIMFLIIIHVNSFVLLSGYFQSKSKFKLSKLLKLLLQVIFYSVIILIFAIKVGWIKEYSIVTFINNISLSSLNNYWFIKTYIIMYIFSDYINKFIDRLEKEEYKKFILLCFIILSVIPYITGGKVLYNDGYNFFNFIFIYMIGGYLRRYPLKETYHFKNMSLNGYRMFLITTFIFLGFSNYLINSFALNINSMSNIFNEISSRILISKISYSTPFVVIQTILYFELFKTLNIKSKLINVVSSCAFGVYLIHDNEIVRAHLYRVLQIDNALIYGYMIIPKIIIASLIIYIVATMIEFVRKIICSKILKLKIVKSMILKFKKFITSFNLKLNW